MKIGILTFHFAHNYGAMLQAYALQEVLRKYGYNAGIIDYEPEYHLKKFPSKITWRSCITSDPKTLIHNIGKKLLSYSYYEQRYESFIQFKKNRMHLFPYNDGFDGIGYDCIIVGSDQIWNPNLTRGKYDGMYFGKGFKCPVISYGASNQAIKLSEYDRQQYSELMAGMKAIGVRETKLMDLLQPLTDKTIHVNLDPTLVADKSIYDDFDSKAINKKYVLVYEIGTHNEVVNMAKTYAKQISAQLVCLVGAATYKNIHGFDLAAGPEEFVSYIRNAECVFTTSFHGTALSVINHKNFYSIRQNTAGDIRMVSLLGQLGLIDRFIPMGSKPSGDAINYGAVVPKLEELRKESLQYLFDSLT